MISMRPLPLLALSFLAHCACVGASPADCGPLACNAATHILRDPHEGNRKCKAAACTIADDQENCYKAKPLWKNAYVDAWSEANEGKLVPNVGSAGWRVVVRNAPGGYWCVSRLKFLDPNHQDVYDGLACSVVGGPKEDFTKNESFPDNAFKDSADHGCSLKDSQGLHFLGLVCDEEKNVQSVEVVQTGSTHSAEQGRVQQLHNGKWVDVIVDTELPNPGAKVIFEAATCKAIKCEGEFMPKEDYELPQTCAEKKCTVEECCKRVDVCDLATCPPYYGLQAGKAGTFCEGKVKCDVSDCCVKLGICKTENCKKPWVPLPSFPSTCKTGTCTDEECCHQICEESVCAPDNTCSIAGSGASKVCSKARASVDVTNTYGTTPLWTAAAAGHAEAVKALQQAGLSDVAAQPARGAARQGPLGG